VARVLALLPDLLFGSKVQGMLTSAGHEVEVIASEPDAWDQIAGSDVFIVDLCSDDIDGIGLVDTLAAGGELHDTKVMAFFRHTEPDVRERALAVGFDLVVPRSRMNREGAALVDGLLTG